MRHLFRLNVSIALVLALFAPGLPQMTDILANAKYGKIVEIKSMKRVHIVADSRLSLKPILDEFGKYSGVEVVGSADEAEFTIGFFFSDVTYLGRITDLSKPPDEGLDSVSPDTRRPLEMTRDYEHAGEMVAFTRADKSRPRIVWRRRLPTKAFTQDSPSDAFIATREFIRALKKVRGEKQ